MPAPRVVIQPDGRPLLMLGWITDPRGRRLAPDLAPRCRFVHPDAAEEELADGVAA